MTVTFQGLAEVYGSETVSKPAGLADGETLFVILDLFDGAPSVPAAPVGWTRVASNVNGIDALGAYYRYVVTASGEPADYTFSAGGGVNDYTAIIIARYSGCDPAGPWDTQDVDNGDTSGPVTVARDGSMAVFCQATDNAYVGGEQPAGFTYRTGGDGTFLSDLPVNSGSNGAFTGSIVAANSFVGVLKAAPLGPTIDTQPLSQTKNPGETATFIVAATASGGSLSYQWKLNGVNVSTGSGGTTASYTTATLTASDSGNSYTCAVTDSNGTTLSAAAVLTIRVPPVAPIVAATMMRF